MNPVGLILIGASLSIPYVDSLLARFNKNSIKYKVVEGGKLTSKYLVERIRNGNELHIHKGIDIAAPPGSNIRAVNNGTILDIWPNGKVKGYGNTVLLKHEDGTGSLYGHMQKFPYGMKIGDKWLKGQIIGYVGNTESGTTGRRMMHPHLHLEIHTKATRTVNPDNPPRIDPEEYLRSVGMSI